MVLRRMINRARNAPRSQRALVTDSAGAYLEPPHFTNWAPLKFIACTIPFVAIGSLISKHGAKFLEEYELFVPDDDDDDD